MNMRIIYCRDVNYDPNSYFWTRAHMTSNHQQALLPEWNVFFTSANGMGFGVFPCSVTFHGSIVQIWQSWHELFLRGISKLRQRWNIIWGWVNKSYYYHSWGNYHPLTHVFRTLHWSHFSERENSMNSLIQLTHRRSKCRRVPSGGRRTVAWSWAASHLGSSSSRNLVLRRAVGSVRPRILAPELRGHAGPQGLCSSSASTRVTWWTMCVFN